MSNASVIIQCRFNSSRLLGKALYPICRIPMLTFLIQRLKQGLNSSFKIILATTKNLEDDIIEQWGNSLTIPVVRGDESDLLKRFCQTIKLYPSKSIVRVTADNPLTCPNIIKWLVEEQHNQGLDYAVCMNLPYGTGVDVFSDDSLFFLNSLHLNDDEREHINLHILNNKKKFNLFLTQIKDERARPDINLTVDNYEDWKRINALFKSDEKEPWKISLTEAITRMDKNSI